MRCMQYAFSALIGFPIFLFLLHCILLDNFFIKCVSLFSIVFSSAQPTDAAGAFAAWIHHMWNSFNDQRPTTPIKPHVLSLNSRHAQLNRLQCPERPTICTCTDHSTSSSKPYTIIFFECYMILFFTIFVTKLCWDWMYLLNYDKYHPEELVYDDNALAAKLKWTLGLITTIWWRTTVFNGSPNDGRWSEIAAELLVLQSHYSRRQRWWWISVVRCSLRKGEEV